MSCVRIAAISFGGGQAMGILDFKLNHLDFRLDGQSAKLEGLALGGVFQTHV